MNSQRGFTLMEVLVVTLIGFGIMAGLTSLYLSGQGTYLQATLQLQSQRDAALIVDQFALRAREANSATITGGNAVQFKAQGGANTYAFAAAGSPAHFQENGADLVFTQVDSLGFSFLALKTIKMGIVVSDKYSQKYRTYATAVMRN